jgi:hypothetical protein
MVSGAVLSVMRNLVNSRRAFQHLIKFISCSVKKILILESFSIGFANGFGVKI